MPGIDQTFLLLVDDDPVYCQVLARALAKRGFAVEVAHDVAAALARLEDGTPQFAVVDLNLPGPSGLTLVQALHGRNPAARIVVLTGYASIATAVEAIKLGATYYLAKPAEADEIVAALSSGEAGNPDLEVLPRPMSVNRLEWEHLQKVLAECGGNISEASRRLGMHRRSLQRKLKKRPARS